MRHFVEWGEIQREVNTDGACLDQFLPMNHNNGLGNTLAHVEARTDALEKNLDRLSKAVEGLAGVSQDLIKGHALMQQEVVSITSAHRSTADKVQTLIDNKNMIKGGWWALTALASVLVTLSGILGYAIKAILTHDK